MMKLKTIRSKIRQFSEYSLKYKKTKKQEDHYDTIQDDSSKLLKFDVKQKVSNKWENRLLAIRQDTDGQWILYLISDGLYTCYDFYHLSANFIAQIYDNNDTKCDLIVLEDVLHLKMSTFSDKWRLVEFIKANIPTNGRSYYGMVKHQPGTSGSCRVPVKVHILKSTMVIINLIKNTIISHQSLSLIGMIVLVDKEIYMTTCQRKELRKGNNEHWTIRFEDVESIWKYLENVKMENKLNFHFSQLVPELPKRCVEYIEI